MTDSQQKTIETYYRLMNANAMTQTFLLARKLGVFESLKEGQKTAQQLAEKLDLNQHALQLVLNQLCETGYVENYDQDYALSMLGQMLPYEWSDLGQRYWDQLENWLRKGERLESPDADFENTEVGIESKAFEWMSTPNALEMIQILNIGQSRKGMRLIELACGSAVFSSAFGYHDPEMQVCLVDSADNLERAKATVASVEITPRCQFVDADPIVYKSKFEADLILLANSLWQYDDSELKSLLVNAGKQLNKKGEIAILDEFCESGDKRLSLATHGILTEFRTPKGKYRSKKEMTELLLQCGFVDVMYSDLKSPPGTKGVLVAGISEV